MGFAGQHFRFARCAIEYDMTTSEGIFVSHYPIQSENYKIGCARSFDFYN